jgi:hypothetical protein
MSALSPTASSRSKTRPPGSGAAFFFGALMSDADLGKAKADENVKPTESEH